MTLLLIAAPRKKRVLREAKHIIIKNLISLSFYKRIFKFSLIIFPSLFFIKTLKSLFFKNYLQQKYERNSRKFHR